MTTTPNQGYLRDDLWVNAFIIEETIIGFHINITLRH